MVGAGRPVGALLAQVPQQQLRHQPAAQIDVRGVLLGGHRPAERHVRQPALT
ncbi:hypothetical protein ACF1GS_05945 [Streptomyces eurythermus]|uniref:hypothetical protein n=1 Tax=Streptomyces eurythermus TaxID=42237 RepID=UPI0036F4EE70